jgi:hypothetical protein
MDAPLPNKRIESGVESASELREQVLAGLLASDLAVEIQAEFNGRLGVGLDVPGATGYVLGKFHSALTSPQEGPVVLIALAALQMREGYLQAVMQTAALDLIESGEALAAYKPVDFSQRKSVAVMLEQFREMIGDAKAEVE